MKYRSRTEIASLILEAANSGSTKTNIMYKAFLSHAQLKEYLSFLIENGLLEHDKRDQIYKTTDKGFKFNKLYSQLDGIVSAREAELTQLPRL